MPGFTEEMRDERTNRDRIAAIAKRADSDQVFGVFGAGEWGHRFEVALHSPEQMVLFEEQLGVRLPEEYVHLLTETGSGAGPYYGLFSPGKVLAEIETLNATLGKEGRKLPSAADPFPFRQRDADEMSARGTIEAAGKAVWLADGCIPICCHGCTFFTALVTAGELRGTAWSVNDDGEVAQWWPGGRPPGLLGEGSFESGRFVPTFKPRALPTIPSPPTLLQWYESWLERIETDLDDYEEFLRKKR